MVCIDLNQISVREIFASKDIDVIRDLCGDEAGADIMVEQSGDCEEG